MISSPIKLDTLSELARTYGVPWLDVLFIATNAFGARSTLEHPRARMQLRPRGSGEFWQVILPLDSPDSPFELSEDGLRLEGCLVAELLDIENDDVVLTYLRAGGRSVTLNTYSRSQCTGCLFCPNVIEDAADATLKGVDKLSRLLTWVEADNGWSDLSAVEIITVCSGCFHHADAAVEHMSDLRTAASQHGFKGRLHLLSSVVRERKHLEQLAEHASPFHLTLTLECFTRRALFLKDSKASLTMKDACRILDDCAEFDMLGDFTYVAGLDPLDDAVAGLRELIPHLTTFPRIQVFQAHNEYMRRSRAPEANRINFYLDLRTAVEDDLFSAALAPKSWENYRPLWYSAFSSSVVEGPRV